MQFTKYMPQALNAVDKIKTTSPCLIPPEGRAKDTTHAANTSHSRLDNVIGTETSVAKTTNHAIRKKRRTRNADSAVSNNIGFRLERISGTLAFGEYGFGSLTKIYFVIRFLPNPLSDMHCA